MRATLNRRIKVDPLKISPSEFVEAFNQLIESALPVVFIEGEVSGFKISKNKWVYFDLKDEEATVHFFGTVFSLPGVIEDGMIIKVLAEPRVSPQYGFSLFVRAIEYSGEGELLKAFELLKSKLDKEGLFGLERKRALPNIPKRVALITSLESAAYADFIKIVNERWSGLEVLVADVAVQGVSAPSQIVEALNGVNMLKDLPEVIVICRGGGSADDLQTFNNEMVVRAVAASRVPCLVAIGHETDVTLAELVADLRASTPSNAAQLLVPDKKQILSSLSSSLACITEVLKQDIARRRTEVEGVSKRAENNIQNMLTAIRKEVVVKEALVESLSPAATLRRGYVLAIDGEGKVIRSASGANKGNRLKITWHDGQKGAIIE